MMVGSGLGDEEEAVLERLKGGKIERTRMLGVEGEGGLNYDSFWILVWASRERVIHLLRQLSCEWPVAALAITRYY
jgi:hypothetical protein